MKIKKVLLPLFAILLVAPLVFNSCEDPDEPTPTNELMEGVWKLTEAYNVTTSKATGEVQDSSILSTVTGFFPTFVWLDNKNSVISTAGPLFFYIVYGNSKFMDIQTKMDDIFSYTSLSFCTNGEWFIDKNKVVDEFTIEMKLLFPSMETFNDIFNLLNVDLPEIVEDAMGIVVYHRFKHITVDVSDDNPNQMVWEFTDAIEADYSTKDQYGDKVVYNPFSQQGVDPGQWKRCKLVFTKQIKTLEQLIEQENSGTTK